LIDEYHLFVNPAAIGRGLAIFQELEHALPLTLVSATAFDCGIVCLCYAPKRSD
jgi:riboflavin biosynthesis pyrimidine reductase